MVSLPNPARSRSDRQNAGRRRACDRLRGSRPRWIHLERVETTYRWALALAAPDPFVRRGVGFFRFTLLDRLPFDPDARCLSARISVARSRRSSLGISCEAREHLVLLFTNMMLHVPLEIGHAIVDTGLVRSCVLEAG